MGGEEHSTAESPSEGAARRLIRLSSDRVDEADRAELARWRAADQRHDLAWRETLALWQQAGALRQAGGRVQPPRRLGRRAAIAAGAAGLATSAGLLWDRGGPRRLLVDLATGTAETAHRDFPDGSAFALDARSAADLELSGATRRLRLFSGAVFVEPGPDPRPLQVTAGAASIVMAGQGAFAVSLRGSGVQLAVARGTARLFLGGTSAGAGSGRLLEVVAGRLLPPRTVSVSGIGAWRQGRLVAEDRPVEEVAEGLGAHFRGLILLRGEAATRRVSAAFDLADVPAALAALAQVLGLDLTWPMPRVAMLRG